MNDSLSVKMQYRSNRIWQNWELKLSSYFDLSDGEIPEIDAVPMHAHAIDYIDISSSIDATRILITDRTDQSSREITEFFWNKRQNRLIERTDRRGNSLIFWEGIIEIQVESNPPKYELVRFGRDDSLLSVLSHCLIQERVDGSEAEETIFP